MPDEILILPGVVDLPKLAKKTAYAVAHPGVLPAFTADGQGRLKHVDIDPWIEEQRRSPRN